MGKIELRLQCFGDGLVLNELATVIRSDRMYMIGIGREHLDDRIPHIRSTLGIDSAHQIQTTLALSQGDQCTGSMFA